MRTHLVYIDDAAHGQSLMAQRTAEPAHWLLVACAPKMTHRIGKWVSHTSRENWRNKWATKLFDQIVPYLQARGQRVTTFVARGPLPALAEELLQRHPDAEVLDLRRPKLLQQPEAVGAAPTAQTPTPVVTIRRRWNLPGAVAGVFGLAVVFSE